ncbi:hypothetical protein IMSHALPRED_004687 [Imshaugia aleurites]|uniref:Uncharacterized protein n=1 Tax=Imshaugia aleurites TaxID=172621 RepID=A0A8H3F8F7_9LECA|nr:hypothetical protein IMSHALPRED_004687 [Imshaugia aleurites]
MFHRTSAAIPSNDPLNEYKNLFRVFSQDGHNWDTIIVCLLLGDLFGGTPTHKDLANVIAARDGRTYGPFEPENVVGMFQIARMPSARQEFPMTCRYEKWEAVKKNLEARNGRRDLDDQDEMAARVLYIEALTTLNMIASEQGRAPSTVQYRGSNANEEETEEGGKETSPLARVLVSGLSFAGRVFTLLSPLSSFILLNSLDPLLSPLLAYFLALILAICLASVLTG